MSLNVQNIHHIHGYSIINYSICTIESVNEICKKMQLIIHRNAEIQYFIEFNHSHYAR